MREDLNECVTVVPNFPKEGVSFKDISPLIQTKFKETAEAMLALFSPEEINEVDVFVGLESRGFILAAAMAALTGKGFVMARKKGKLPNVAGAVSYALEYGSATIEMQAGKGKAVVVDDVIATGGSLEAGADLAEQVGYEVTGLATLINLQFLNNFDWKGMKCRSVLDYDASGALVEPLCVQKPSLN